MKNKILIFLICLLLLAPLHSVKAEGYGEGWTDWSTSASGDPNEQSATQYGRQTPASWSAWSEAVPGETMYYKTRTTSSSAETLNIAYSYWSNANAKTIFEYEFGETVTVTHFSFDVDVAKNNNGSWTNYAQPAMQLYIDDSASPVASSSRLDNATSPGSWETYVNIECHKITLKMLADTDGGRNTTAIYAHSFVDYTIPPKTEYSTVAAWNSGSDWRLDEPYIDVKTGAPEQIQKATSRTVYSYPITYTISYDLDGGYNSALNVSEYTVLDNVAFYNPSKINNTFLGWYLEPEFKNRLLNINAGTHQNINLYAKWEPIIYEYDGSYFTKGEDKNNEIIYPRSYHSTSYNIEYNTSSGTCEYN